MTSKVYILATTIALLCVCSNASFAKDKAVAKTKALPEKPIINIEAEATKGIILDDVTYDKNTFKLARPKIDHELQMLKSKPFKEIKSLYKDTRYINLTHLYWKTGVLSVDNNTDLDAYLLLTQCKHVGGSYSNDFEWSGLREKAKLYIEQNKEKFTKKFRFSQPLKLGAYDLEKEEFKIDEKYDYKKSKRFLISNNARSRGDFCLLNNFANKYTSYAAYNVVMSSKRPFNLTKLPVSKDVSRLYIDYINQHGLSKTAKIVFYINLELFQGTKKEMESREKFVNEFTGKIDYVEVFADKDETRLLYKMDLR